MGPTPTNYLAGDPPELLAQVHVIRNARGTHTTVSRAQGNRLKTKREIRIATMFRDMPEAFLRMIVVHELAHLKESAHDKPFYALCTWMEPDYHSIEFDLRLALTHQAMHGALGWGVAGNAAAAAPGDIYHLK